MGKNDNRKGEVKRREKLRVFKLDIGLEAKKKDRKIILRVHCLLLQHSYCNEIHELAYSQVTP